MMQYYKLVQNRGGVLTTITNVPVNWFINYEPLLWTHPPVRRGQMFMYDNAAVAAHQVETEQRFTRIWPLELWVAEAPIATLAISCLHLGNASSWEYHESQAAADEAYQLHLHHFWRDEQYKLVDYDDDPFLYTFDHDVWVAPKLRLMRPMMRWTWGDAGRGTPHPYMGWVREVIS